MTGLRNTARIQHALEDTTFGEAQKILDNKSRGAIKTWRELEGLVNGFNSNSGGQKKAGGRRIKSKKKSHKRKYKKRKSHKRKSHKRKSHKRKSKRRSKRR